MKNYVDFKSSPPLPFQIDGNFRPIKKLVLLLIVVLVFLMLLPSSSFFVLPSPIFTEMEDQKND